MAVAAASLSAFWAAMVVGRLAVSIAVLRVPSERIWLALPVLMIFACMALPFANTSAFGIGLFALFGLACSAFFHWPWDSFPATLSNTSRGYRR